MEFTKIILNKSNITKIKYKENATIVYTQDKVYICRKNSEKEFSNDFVEYILMGKGE